MSLAAARPPAEPTHETVACYLCGSREGEELLWAEDDLCGTPGSHRFVTCSSCGLAYQNPRLTQQAVAAHYGDDYIAHRKRDWGRLQPLFDRAMGKLDRDKESLASRWVPLTSSTRVLDAGCGAGTFLQRLRERRACEVAGVDFADLEGSPALQGVEFRRGLFAETDIGVSRFDLITMWHFLEHDYDPLGSLGRARRALKPDGVLLIEVPRLDSVTARIFGRRWPGLQAPQHTLLLSRDSLHKLVRKAGLEVIDYLPWGAFPAYFYLFTGTAFLWQRGRGLNLNRLLLPYLLGQIPALPLILAERRLNLAMQTIVCRPGAEGRLTRLGRTGGVMRSPAASLHPANLLTYAGLAAALLAVGAALGTGDWRLAGAGLAIAALADLADGRFASLFARSPQEKDFGVQLDSLADAVCFGGLPAVAALALAPAAGPWSTLLPLAAVAYVIAAVTRLGAFNVAAEHGRFVGMPTTVAGLICSTLFLFEPSAEALTAVLIGCAAAMVAPLPIPRPRTALLLGIAGWGCGLILAHLLR